jgi:tRNA(adenine34) deaminase
METPFGSRLDHFFMQAALTQARKAFAADEVPVGSVIVNGQGIIVARAHNRVEATSTQTAHAEMIALARAGKKIKDWRLQGYWLYVTLEPCSMCMYAIMASRVTGVVYGAPSPLFGYHLDKDITDQLYKNDILTTIAGVCSQESVDFLKTFFQKKRIKGG